MRIRRELMRLVHEIVERDRLSDYDIADMCRTSVPRGSNLIHGHIERFNSETLIDILWRMGVTVEVVVTNRRPYPRWSPPRNRRPGWRPPLSVQWLYDYEREVVEQREVSASSVTRASASMVPDRTPARGTAPSAIRGPPRRVGSHRLADAVAQAAQRFPLIGIGVQDVPEQGPGGRLAELDWLGGEPTAAEVTLGVETQRLAEHHLFVAKSDAHGDKPLPRLLHEAKAKPVGLPGPGYHGMTAAVVALVAVAVSAERGEVAFESALEPNRVPHVDLREVAMDPA